MHRAKAIPTLPAGLHTHFWRSVQRSGEGCWLWTGQMGPTGYGVYRFDRVNYPAHRIAVALSGRVVSEGDVVMHSCDNRICVNPNHLTIGTQGENVRDMVAKGRAACRGDRAEREWRRMQDEAVE